MSSPTGIAILGAGIFAKEGEKLLNFDGLSPRVDG
jgi:hypothetical protein